jgi:RecA-family ATPase
MKNQPSNAEAERALIGSVIRRPETLENLPTISAAQFHLPQNAALWKAILSLQQRDFGIDPVTIYNEAGDLAGSVSDIAEYASAIGTPELATYYAQCVIEAAKKRQLILIASQLAKDAYDGRLTSTEALDYASKSLCAVDETISRPDKDEPFPVYPLEANAPVPTDWIVKDLVPAETCIVLGAEEKTGKSWLMFDLAICLATGQDLLGRFKPARTGKTLIYSPESGMAAIIRRMWGLCWGRELNPREVLPSIKLIHTRINLAAEEHLSRMRATIRKYEPIVLVIDPLICAHLGIVEKDAEDMQPLLDSIRSLTRDRPEMAIIVAHHLNKTNKDKTPMHGLRGSTALGGWTDGLISIRKENPRDPYTARRVDAEHRDAIPPSPISFTIKQKALPLALEMPQDVFAYKLDPCDVTDSASERTTKIDPMILFKVLESVRNNSANKLRGSLADTNGIPRNTFNKYITILEEQGKVELIDGKYPKCKVHEQ